MSQTDHDVIQNLDNAGLLSKREKKEQLYKQEAHLAKPQKGHDIYIDANMRKRPHCPLELLARAKIYSTSGVLFAFYFKPAAIEIKKGKEQLFINNLTQFYKKLLSAKLVTDKNFK